MIQLLASDVVECSYRRARWRFAQLLGQPLEDGTYQWALERECRDAMRLARAASVAAKDPQYRFSADADDLRWLDVPASELTLLSPRLDWQAIADELVTTISLLPDSSERQADREVIHTLINQYSTKETP